MRKKLFGRLLSVVLSATLAFTPSLTAFAGEGSPDEPIVVDTEQDEEADTYAPEQGEPAGDVEVEAADDVLIVDEDGEDARYGAELEDEERLGVSATVTVRFLTEAGGTFASQNVPVADVAAATEPVLLTASNTFPDKDYYEGTAWSLKEANSKITLNHLTTGDNKGKYEISFAANTFEGSTTVDLVPSYTAKTYSIYYAASTDTDQNKMSFSNYVQAWNIEQSEMIALPPAPSQDHYEAATWYLGTVSKSTVEGVTTITVTPTATEIINNNVDASTNVYYLPAANAATDIGFFADYGAKNTYTVRFAGTQDGSDKTEYDVASSGTDVAYSYTLNEDQAQLDETTVLPKLDSNYSIELLAPSRDEYTFDGWYTDAAFTKAVPSSSNKWTFTVDAQTAAVTTFYPKWIANEYAVVFSDGKGAGETDAVSGLPTNVKIAVDGKIEITTVPSRESYAFKGYEVVHEGGTTAFAEFDASGRQKDVAESGYVAPTVKWVYSLPLANVGVLTTESNTTTLRVAAVWDVEGSKVYDIDYDLNRGDISATYAGEYPSHYSIFVKTDKTGDPDGYIIFGEHEPTRANYTFEGWYTDPLFASGSKVDVLTSDNTASGHPYYGLSADIGSYVHKISATEDIDGITFYANWTRDDGTYVDINYVLNGFEQVDENVEEVLLSLPINPASGVTFALEGLADTKTAEFTGWYADAECLNKVAGAAGGTYTVFDIAEFDKTTKNGKDYYSITFYAGAKAKTEPTVEHTVDYDLDDAYVYPEDWDIPFDVEDGYLITADDLPTKLAKQDYVFDKWVYSSDPSKAVAVGDEIKTDTTLLATWKPVKYTVTFHAGISGVADVTKSYDVNSGASIKFRDIYDLTAVSSAKAADFEWWDTSVKGLDLSANGNTLTAAQLISKYYNAIGIDDYPYGDAEIKLDLYADYGVTDEEFTVKYNAYPTSDFDAKYAAQDFANSDFAIASDADLIQYKTLKVGETLVLSGHEFVRKGYKLTGWKCGATTYKPDQEITFSAEDGDLVELVAVWAKETKNGSYSIKLNVNGGKYTKGYKAPSSYKYEDGATLPTAAEITKVGYNFGGWYLDTAFEDGPYSRLGRNTILETGNVVFYAYWTPTFVTITFDSNGGTKLSDTYVSYGYSLPLKNFQTTRAGYKFNTWIASSYVDAKGNAVDGKKFSATANIKNITDKNTALTLTADWIPNTYSITYKPGTGAAFDSKSATKSFAPEAKKNVVSAADVVIPIPTRDGYKFAGYAITPKDPKKENIYGIKEITWSSDAASYVLAPSKTNATTGAIEEYKLSAGDYGNIVLTALWTPLTYDFKFKNGSADIAIPSEYASLFTNIEYSDTKVDLSQAIKAGSTETASLAGFAAQSGSAKASYAINKTYKMADIVKAAGSTEAGGKNVVTLYAVADTKIKYFVTTKVTVDGEETVTSYSYVPKDGFKVPTPKVTGYTFEKWSVSGGTLGTDYTVNGSDGAGDATIKKADTSYAGKNNMVFSTTLVPTKYKVTVMPNASDVKINKVALTDAQKKDGVLYKNEALAYNNAEVADIDDYSSWTRDGYTLVGFSLGKSATKKTPALAELDLRELKATNVKFTGAKTSEPVVRIYAIWQANGLTVELSTDAKVTNNEAGLDQFSSMATSYSKIKAVKAINVGVGTYEYQMTSTFGKQVNLPKPSLTGYKFVGWTYDKTTYPNAKVKMDKKGVYATAVDKANTTRYIKFTPVFQEVEYQVTINPNGGTYGAKGKNATKFTEKVKYSDGIEKYTDIIYGSGMVRSGYYVNAVATVKAPKKAADYVAHPEDFRSVKAVTLYPVWESATAKKEMQISAEYDGTYLSGKAINLEPGTQYIIEYSKDKNFQIGVSRLPAMTTGANSTVLSVPPRSVPAANQYYVRICKANYNGSTVTYGDWKVATAAAPVDGAVVRSITVKYVVVTGEGTSLNYDDTVGTVTVTGARSEKVNNLKIPALSNHTGDGKFYTSKVVTADNLVADDVLLSVAPSVFYTKVTAIDRNIKVKFIASNGKKDAIDIVAGTTKWSDIKSSLSAPSGMENALGEFTGWKKGSTQISSINADGTVKLEITDAVITDAYEDIELTAQYDTTKAYAYTLHIANKVAVETTGAKNELVDVTGKYGDGKTIATAIPSNTLTAPAGKQFDRWEVVVAGKTVARLTATDSSKDLSTLTNVKDAEIQILATYKDISDSRVFVDYLYDDHTHETYYSAAGYTAQANYSIAVNGIETAAVVATVNADREWTPREGYVRDGSDVVYGYYDEDEVWQEYSLAGYTMGQYNNRQVFIKFKPIEYTVKYYKNITGAESADAYDQNANFRDGDDNEDGAAALTDVTAFTRDGYTFAGWNTDPDGEGKFIAVGGSLAGLTSTAGVVNLYAQWTPLTVQVKFLPNGGSGVVKTETINYHEDKKSPANAFTKAGYKFLGWAKSADAGVIEAGLVDEFNYKVLDDASITNGKIIKLYAVWGVETYTITYNANGGTGSASQQTWVYGDATGSDVFKASNTFTKDGYTLIGWATSPTGDKVFNCGASINENAASFLTYAGTGTTVTLYAKWVEAPTMYTVTNTLSHVSTNKDGVTSVVEGDTYTATLTADEHYTITTVEVTMGGVDITDTAYTEETGAISIAVVTGNIVITATAIEEG